MQGFDETSGGIAAPGARRPSPQAVQAPSPRAVQAPTPPSKRPSRLLNPNHTPTYDPEKARARRKALQDFIGRHGLTPTELCRRAGMSTPNAVYNFLHERTTQLTQETYEKLARAVPGTTVEDLTGMMLAPRPCVMLRMEAQAGVLRDAAELPLFECREIYAPVDADDRASGAFGVLVRGAGMERVWSDRTLVVCRPLATLERPLAPGRRVLVQRHVGGKVEVTIREIVLVDGRHELHMRSRDPHHQGTVEMPWPYPGKPWKGADGWTYTVQAVVTMACVPEH